MKEVFRELTNAQNSSIIIKEEVATQFTAPFHFHKGFELLYMAKGRGKFYGGNRLLNFQDNELYLFGVDFPHLFVNEKSFIDANEIGHSIIVQFTEDYFSYNFALMPEFSLVKSILKTSLWGIKIADPHHELKKLFLSISKKEGLQTIITLLQILDIISKLPQSKITIITSNALKSIKANSSKDEKLLPVFQYILENFKDEVTTKQAAALAFMNEAAFCRYFKRRTNKTLSQFLNNVRITHSTSLLSEEVKSITEVCYESGFENISYFNRQFKDIIGKTPSQFRKNIKKYSL